VQVRMNLTNTNANGTLTVSKNIFTGETRGNAVRLDVFNNQLGGNFDADVRNNLIVREGGASGRSGIYANSTQITGPATFDIVHNTIVGDFNSAGIGLNGSNAAGMTGNVQDNIVRLSGSGFASISDYTSVDGPNFTINNNLVNVATTPGDNGDVSGDPQFVNPIDRQVVLVVTDPVNNEVETVGAPVSVGDRVVIANTMTVRTVVASVPPFVTLDGDPIAATSGAVLSSLVWSADSFVAPIPDYNLATGSPGIDAATDGTDLGAYGGSDPLTP
ncbi:MAG: hypothetical protein AAF645_25845, partial [Myxococcota bacterium]